MTGCSNSEGVGKEFGLKVMKHLNDKCAEWKQAENIDYSPYGSPIESTTYKFAKCLKKRFGIIEGITDRDYIRIRIIFPFSRRLIRLKSWLLKASTRLLVLEVLSRT